MSYCSHAVYTHDYDRFLLSLFVPAPMRESLLALYALHIELDNIRRAVSEEMIGHIRHAWWREEMGKLYEGVAPRGQPVLQALAPVIAAGQLPHTQMTQLLDQYAEHFPSKPPGIDSILDTLAERLIASIDIKSLPGWSKARHIIGAHRQKYDGRRDGWLKLKLLLAGAC